MEEEPQTHCLPSKRTQIFEIKFSTIFIDLFVLFLFIVLVTILFFILLQEKSRSIDCILL